MRSPLAPLAPLAVAALLAVSATAGEARANPRSPEVLKALEALRDKRFEDALKACAPKPYREARPECPLIRAHALHALGKHLEAYEALRTFGAQESGEAKNAPLARETFRSALLANLARVSVVCSTPGPAEVLVNGKLAKTCPTTGSVVTEPGEIVIEVKREGFKTARMTMPATAGGTVTARIDLVPIRGSSPAPATAPNENDAGQTPETPEPSPQSTAPPSTEMIDADEPSTGKRKRIDPASYATPVTPTDTSSSSSSSGGGSGISRDHKYVLLTLGVLAAIGITAGIIIALTHETKPAETGTVGSGQVKVPPLAAW